MAGENALGAQSFGGTDPNRPLHVYDNEANHVLEGIYSFLNKNLNNSSSLEDINDSLGEIVKDGKLSENEVRSDNKAIRKALTGIVQNQKKDMVSSTRAEARRRAEDQIFNKDVQKKLSGLDLFKKGLMGFLSGLKDFLGDHFSKSFKTQSELARLMRKANMTRAEKDRVQLLASQSQLNVSDYYANVHASSEEVKDFYGELISMRKNVEAMNDEQRASYIAMRKGGMEADQAYVAAMTSSAKDLQNSVHKLFDPRAGQAAVDYFSNLKASEIAAMGGWSKIMKQGTAFATEFTEKSGMAGVASGDAAELFTAYGKKSAGLYDRMSDNEAMLTALGKTMGGAMDNLKSKGAFYARRGVIPESWANADMMAKAGVNIGARTYTEEELAQAAEANLPGGKIQYGFDKLTSALNVMTGGMFGSMANAVDEWFGDSEDITTITSKGFKLVISILTAIKGSELISGGIGKLAEVFGGGKVLGKLKGIFTKAPKGNVMGAVGEAGSALGKAGKFAKIGKFAGKAAKGLPIVGTIAGIGLAAYDIYDAASYKPEDISTAANSKAVKDEEKSLQKQMKAAKVTGSVLKTGAMAAGAIAGAKMGAVIGTAIPIPVVGTAIGAVVGTAIGATAGVVVDHFVEASNNLKDTEIRVKSLEDLDAQIKELDDTISNTTDASLRDQLIALRENTAAQRDILRKQLNEKESAHWAKMTGGTTDQAVIDDIRKAMVSAGDTYNAQKEIIANLQSSQSSLQAERERLEKLGDTTGIGNIDAKLTLVAAQLRQAEEIKDEARKTELSARLALEKGIDTNLAEKYGESAAEILQNIGEDASSQYWVHKEADFEKHISERLLDQLDEGTGGNELYDHIVKLSNSQAYTFLTERAKSAGMKNQEAIDDFIMKAMKASTDDVGDKAKFDKFVQWLEDNKKIANAQLAEQKKANDLAQQPTDINLKANAAGGIYNSFTPAAVGEDGKELVLPLTKPDKVAALLQQLAPGEKKAILNALLGRGKLSGFVSNLISSLFGSSKDGIEQTAEEKSEYEAALAKLDAWQGGRLKPADFIAMFGPIAREDMRATGIPAAITIAQAALESGWGKSARADFRNLFGIKGVGDAGSKVIPTHEFNTAGQRYNKHDTFAQYSSYLASINAHSHYLLTSKRKKGLNGLRYGEALLYTDDSDMFAHKLKECGYATSPTYAEKLIGLMRKYDLYKYNVNGAKPNVNGTQLSEAAQSQNSSTQQSSGSSVTMPSSSEVPGEDAATLQKILSYASDPAYVRDSMLYGRNKNGSLKSKDSNYGPNMRKKWYQEAIQNAANQEGRDLIKGTYAERALEWGVSQLGKHYLLRSIGKLGYVCNELTNAAIMGSGFDIKDFRIHGVGTTFANIERGKYVSGNKDRKGRVRYYPEFRLRPDITPETAVPGMVFFQQSGKNKDGSFSPGHVGLVYYGHQKLHSSGGSGSYDNPASFLAKWQTPCRGVTVTPFDNGNYRFGEFPGLFEQASGEWAPPKNTTVQFGPDGEVTSVSTNKSAEATKKELEDLVTEGIAGVSSGKVAEFIDRASKYSESSGANSSVRYLIEVVKYLREIALRTKSGGGSPSKPVRAPVG